MKKNLSIIISLLAGLVAVWIIITKISVQEILNVFTNNNWQLISLYITAVLGVMITISWRWSIILKSQGHKIPFWNIFWYKMIGQAISYMTPTAKIGGEPVRAGLLKKHSIKFKEALSSVVIDKTIELSTSGLFFTIGMAILLFSKALKGEAMTFFEGLAIILTIITIAFYFQMFRGKEFFGKIFRLTMIHKTRKGLTWEQKLRRFEKTIIKFYHKDKKYFWQSIITTIISWCFTFLEFKIILIILGYEQATALQVFLIFSFVGAAYLVPTPMAIGSLEAGQVGVFALIGLAPAAGMAVALITRTKDTILAILGFIALSIFGLDLNLSTKTINPTPANTKK